jgi:hypothetical protein
LHKTLIVYAYRSIYASNQLYDFLNLCIPPFPMLAFFLSCDDHCFDKHYYFKSEMIKFLLDMKDSGDPSLMNENLCSSLKRLCVNEISVRNHSYIISMCINDSEQTQLDIKIEAKETADQWKSTFDINGKCFNSFPY